MAAADTGALVEHARAGDSDAWEALYRRAYPRLLAYAQRRLDGDGARDAVSETMARAVANIGHYRPVAGSGGPRRSIGGAPSPVRRRSARTRTAPRRGAGRRPGRGLEAERIERARVGSDVG